MKPMLFFLFILIVQTSFAQNKPMSGDIQAKVKQATINYLKPYFTENELKQNVILVDSESTVTLKVPLNRIETGAITAKMISKIEVNVRVSLPEYNDYLNLELNHKFEVKENIAYHRNNENLSALRLNSIKEYIEYHNNKKILPIDTVYQFICRTYPNQLWNKPKVSRNSFPPYTFYYEALENQCNPCKQIRIQLNELKEMGSNNVDMIPLKK